MNLYKYLCEITKQILFINKKSTKYPPKKEKYFTFFHFLANQINNTFSQPTN